MKRAFDETLAELQLARPGEVNPWYYPSVSEYAALLESNNFEVRFMTLFDRPTALADGESGMRNWIAMFASDFLAKVPQEKREVFFETVEKLLRPELFKDGQWWAELSEIAVCRLQVKLS